MSEFFLDNLTLIFREIFDNILKRKSRMGPAFSVYVQDAICHTTSMHGIISSHIILINNFVRLYV